MDFRLRLVWRIGERAQFYVKEFQEIGVFFRDSVALDSGFLADIGSFLESHYLYWKATRRI